MEISDDGAGGVAADRGHGPANIASVASGAELLAAIRASPPEAVILGIRMPPSFSDEGIRTGHWRSAPAASPARRRRTRSVC